MLLVAEVACTSRPNLGSCPFFLNHVVVVKIDISTDTKNDADNIQYVT